MAYAAVISLTSTIERLLNSSRISFDVTPCQEIIDPAYEELKSLQEILKRLDLSSKSNSRKKVNALDAQIREAVYQFENKFESHISNQFLSQSAESINGDARYPLLFSIDLQNLRQDVHSFIETAKHMEDEYVDQLINMPEEEDDDEVSSIIDLSGNKSKSKMVGFSDVFGLIRDGITEDERFHVLAIVGMAGIGKTTLVHEIFEDKMVLSHVDCRAWVKVGRKFQLNEIARDILAQVEYPVADEELAEKEIAFYFKEILKKKRCLIVLDDVWDTCVWDYLKRYFPTNSDGRPQILLTTRLHEVAEHTDQSSNDGIKEMRFLSKEESWDLLRGKVFGEDSCPPKLEKAGKKIAENCDGLPLLVVTVADLLSKAQKTPEYWIKVAAQKQHPVFVGAYDKILEVLCSSYEYLPQHLKACFLYMGVFPQNFEIPRSKLINMWIAEGVFFEPSIFRKSEIHAMNYLVELISNSLVIFRRASCFAFYRTADCMKTFSLHSTLWHLANKIARVNKFFHVLSSRSNGSVDDIKVQRRLCIRSNIIFGTKDMFDSREDDCASIARSLVCSGPYHQYPVPIYFDMKLLRVFDALNIRFFEFPLKVLKLFQLRYLALTYNGNLPTSISKLWNLQFLIIHRHMSIHSCGALSYSYVPVEIWDMQELKHFQITRGSLPNSNCGLSLKNLSTLVGVSAYSCTKGVLKRIPNLKKLGIQIEMVPGDDSNPFRCLNRISSLGRLESLKIVVVNPELRYGVVAPPAPLSMFPSHLRKLTLSGLGYPWEYMSIIVKLRYLEILKLQCYAFQGPKWEIKENELERIGFLQIEDTDLVEWKVGRGGLPSLRQLIIKHCYNLEELSWEPDNYVINKIEVVDCNPTLVARVNQIEAAQSARQYPYLGVSLHSSWDDQNLKSTSTPVERNTNANANTNTSFWLRFTQSRLLQSP